MTVYIVTIILIVTLQPVLKMCLGSAKYKNVYIFLIGTWLFGLLVLRSEDIGSDLPIYIKAYMLFGNTAWKDLAEVANARDMEIGYAVLNKLLYMASVNPRFLIVVVSFILVYGFSHEIKLRSNNPAFSFFIYITLGMYVRAFTGYRQQIATVIVLAAYHYIYEKKLGRFLLLLMIASTIHTSVLFLLPMYFIAHVRVDYKVYFGVLAGSIFCIVAGDRIMSHVHYKWYAELVVHGGSGAVGACIIFGAFIVLMAVIWKDFKTLETRMYMHFAIFCLFISCLSFVQPLVVRMLYYFDAVMLYAIPNTVQRVKSISTRYFIICGIGFVLLYYYLCIICRADTGSIVPYSFYWD